MPDWDFRLFGKKQLVEAKLPVAVTFGNFDGVHAGHKQLLRDLRVLAQGNGVVVVTFFPHPTRLFTPLAAKPLLCSLAERVQLLLDVGADCVLVQEFDAAFAALTADEFCSEYLGKILSVRSVLLGYNLSYGKDRRGNWTHFETSAKKLGWNAHLAQPLLVDAGPVSSSRIRDLVAAGDVEEAEKLLGRPFSLKGVVVHGSHLGRTIGFPTANLETANEVIPAFGVYACEVEIENQGKLRLPAVMNYGFRPTVGAHLKLQIEAHILDFSMDIYHCEVTFYLRKFLRSEMKFSGLQQLKEQIEIDTAKAREFFGLPWLEGAP